MNIFQILKKVFNFFFASAHRIAVSNNVGMDGLSMFKPKLNGSSYSNLVTVFAVILAVVYSTESPDIWDVMIGIVSISLGLAFINEAVAHKDFLFSFITAALIGIGLVSILDVLIYAVDGFPESIARGKALFVQELKTFVLFLIITAVIHLFLIRRKYAK